LQTDYPKAVLDGAVNEQEWSGQNDKKILWILKEVNDYAGDLRGLLNDPAKLTAYNRWQATYGLVAKVSYGLLTGKWVEDADTLVKDGKVLGKIAVINVNKLGGTSKASAKSLSEAAEEFHDVILKQIEFLDPDIVILGGVKDVLAKWLPKDGSKRKWIAASHPGQVSITHERYFQQIRSSLNS